MSAARLSRWARGDIVSTRMGAERARAFAEELHHGQRDGGEALLIDHVRRVAAAVRNDLPDHVDAIARASGPGADIAPSVKRADLADRALNPPSRADGWSPPNDLGLQILRDAPPPDTHAPRGPAAHRGWGQHDTITDAGVSRTPPGGW